MKKVLPGLLLVVLSVFIAQKFFPQIRMEQLTVVTIPGGAIVSLNGVPAGLSPLRRFVPCGGVFVVAEKDGFFPSDSLVKAPLDTLFLQLREGCLLVVNTNPPGCQIISSGYAGISPCSLVVESGNSVEITALGEMGISVTRVVNVLTPGVRVVEIAVPFEFTDQSTRFDFSVISRDLLPFAMGPLTVGRYEVTASQFADFMNAVDPWLFTDSTSLRGRTCLMDSILKCNWRGPVGFNADTTAYVPLEGMSNHPMVGMTWNGAEWYCEWFSTVNSTGLEFRLPNCDEWETLAASGSEITVNLSDINETILTRHSELDDGWRETAPSGAMGRSRWGLCEMQGNVWEWTFSEGIAIGGSWLSSVEDCRAESVIELNDNLGYPFVGFRVVATGFPEDIIQSR
ncbi:MAG: SUMF1/EgtB/PvdO family nonheme iron enzyme [Candidatus Sabulitectum sp.]|nr:SUMF1/EgtB/PvdO family nonheme iron enzyme [Candidatus Sabulitectum sp.]